MYRFWPLLLVLACSASPPAAEPSLPTPDPPTPVASEHQPALARLLSAEHTMGFVGIERLDTIVRSFDENLGAFSAEARAQMPAVLTDPVERKARLGFDPTTVKGWFDAGIDPRMGIGCAFDARFDGPILYARITWPMKLLDTLRRLGLTIEVYESDNDRLLPITVNGEPWLIVRLKDYVVAFQTVYSTPSVAQVDALLANPSTVLADDARFKTAMIGAPDTPWLSGYFDTAKVIAPLAGLGDAPRFYADRYAALALAVDAETVMLRLLADEAARGAVKQIFKTTGPVPGFARFLSRDRMTIRSGLQFDTLFDGASALFSPASSVRDLFEQWRSDWTALTAVTPKQLGAALDGHVAVETPLDGVGTPLILAGIRDPARVDALIVRGAATLQTRGVMVSKTQAKGRVTYRMRFGSGRLAVTRTDTTLLIGPPAVVGAAIARADSDLPAAVAKRVDQPTLMMAFTPVNAMDGSDASGFSTATFARLWSGNLLDDFIVSEVQIDNRGLLLSDHFSLMFAAGMFAAVAVPAYMKYTRRRRAEEGRQGLRALVDKAMQASARDGQLLKSTPLTPAAPACKKGQSWRHRVADSKRWQHPTWKTLQFSDDFGLFQYEFISDGRSFTARAKGDLDCDGVFSTLEQTGQLGKTASRPMTVHQLLE